MQNTTGVISGTMYYSKQDAQAMGLSAVRNGIRWDKDFNDGTKQMTPDIKYISNINSWASMPSDMDEYRSELVSIRDTVGDTMMAATIENECITDITTLVQMYGIACDVFLPRGIAVLTSGSFPQYWNGKVAERLSGSDLRAWKARNQCVVKKAAYAAFEQEIDLIHKAGLQDKLTYNWHYQFVDGSYYPDFLQVKDFVGKYTGMKQGWNEGAIWTNEKGIGTVLANACKQFEIAAVYNTNIGKTAKKMTSATQAEFVATLK